MKTFILAAAVGLVAFAPSMLPGSTAQTAQAQSPAIAKCMGPVGSVAKVLRVSPKFATKQNVAQACGMNSARPVLSTAEFLRNYVRTAKIAQRKAPANVVKACPGVVRKAIMASGAGAKAASAENVKRACANGKGRPIIATAGFLSRMTAGVGCVDKTMKALRALRMPPKMANPKHAQTACKIAKNRPAIATRNFLARVTKNAK